MINRSSQGGGYWDEEVDRLTRDSVLLLIGYFDWDGLITLIIGITG